MPSNILKRKVNIPLLHFFHFFLPFTAAFPISFLPKKGKIVCFVAKFKWTWKVKLNLDGTAPNVTMANCNPTPTLGCIKCIYRLGTSKYLVYQYHISEKMLAPEISCIDIFCSWDMPDK